MNKLESGTEGRAKKKGLLTHQEEIELGEIIQRTQPKIDELKRELNKLMRSDETALKKRRHVAAFHTVENLPPEKRGRYEAIKHEIAELSASPEYVAAIQTFVCRNMGLVYWVAKKIRDGRSSGFEDRCQEGVCGLITAAKKFDSAKECRFSTYAIVCMRQSIRRAMFLDSKLVCFPMNMFGEKLFLDKARHILEAQLGRAPENKEVAEYFIRSGKADKSHPRLKSVKVIEEIDAAFAGGVDSIDAFESEEDNSWQQNVMEGEIAAAKGDKLPEELVGDSEIRKQVRALVGDGVVTARERDVVVSLFGIDGKRKETMKEVGQRHGLTQARIGQIQNVAMAKLRRALERKNITLF